MKVPQGDMEVILLQEWRAAWQDVQIGKLGPKSKNV
jgi:hypothetical protein